MNAFDLLAAARQARCHTGALSLMLPEMPAASGTKLAAHVWTRTEKVVAGNSFPYVVRAGAVLLLRRSQSPQHQQHGCNSSVSIPRDTALDRSWYHTIPISYIAGT